jgi:hypothetical protein
MTFIYNNIEYRISFVQIRTNDTRGLCEIDHRGTIARIRTGERDTASEQVVGEGQMFCHHKDPFKLEAGRKNALRTAFANSIYSENREFRTTAWNAYHTRPGGIRNRSTVSLTAKVGGFSL